MQRGRAKTKKHPAKENKKPTRKHVLSVNVSRHKPKKDRQERAEHALDINETSAPGSSDQALLRREAEKYKNLIMWSGVSFFMILIVFVWTLNIKKILNAGVAENLASFASNSELTENLEQLKNNLDDFKKIKDTVDSLKDYSGSVTSTIPKASDQEAVNENKTAQEELIIKEKLEQLEQKLESSP